MYLSFANNCIIQLNEPNSIFKNFLEKEGIIEHAVDSSNSIDLIVDFFNTKENQARTNLRPDAFYDKDGFGFIDINKNCIYVDLSTQSVYKIKVYGSFNPSKLWDILFDQIKYILLTKDIATIHASAFYKDGTNFIISGWDGSGKTSILLYQVENGATFLGDDRVFISKKGEVFPLYSKIKLYPNELLHLKSYKKKISTSNKIKTFIPEICEKIIANSSIKIAVRLANLINNIYRRLFSNYIEIFIKKEVLPSVNKNKFVVIRNGEKTQEDIVDIANIVANTMADELDLIKRYNTYRFYPGSKENQFAEEYSKRLHSILSKGLNIGEVGNIYVNNLNHIENITIC